MQPYMEAGASAPAHKPRRPVLVRNNTVRPARSAEVEVQMLKAELAKVRKELRDLTWATNAFVRSLV